MDWQVELDALVHWLVWTNKGNPSLPEKVGNCFKLQLPAPKPLQFEFCDLLWVTFTSRSQTIYFLLCHKCQGLDIKFLCELVPHTRGTIQLLIFDHFQYSIRQNHPEPGFRVWSWTAGFSCNQKNSAPPPLQSHPYFLFAASMKSSMVHLTEHF